MSDDSALAKINEKSLEAFLDGIREDLRHPADPALLDEVRRAFRKKIPFHLRSYAAALMILRAAGLSRPRPAKTGQEESTGQEDRAGSTKAREVSAFSRSRKNHGLKAEMVPLFVSMGKRHKLRPQDLRTLMAEKTGIPVENIGRVHLLDHYSFIDVPASEAERILTAMMGAELNGRPLEVKPSRKKSELASEG